MQRERSVKLICAALVFLLALALYSYTLAPTVTLVDSGELIVVAHSLGVAHPPGFPLYLMLAHLATWLPFGNVAARVNFASAVFGAFAAAMVTLVVAELMTLVTGATVKKRERKSKPRAEKSTDMDMDLRVAIPALTAGLLTAVSRTLWSYATIAEVYTLNTFLILTLAWLVLRWRRLRDDRLLYAGAFLFGLALGVHHVTVALTLPALALVVLGAEGWRFVLTRRFGYAALISFAALFLVYAYLPLAAARDPLINWGNPRTPQEIWWHITGRQYRAFFSFAPETLAQQFGAFESLILRQFGSGPVGLALSLAGAIYAFRRARIAFWFLLAIVLPNLAYTLGYDIAEDKDAYYLPAFIVLAICAGFGLRWLIELLSSRRLSKRLIYACAAIAVVALTGIGLAANWPFNNRRHYFIAQDYVENIQRTIAPNGLLLTYDWQVAAPIIYTREIEGTRRDVKLIDVNLLRRSWYFDYLRKAYPEMMARSAEQVVRFEAELRRWEQDPSVYARDGRLTQRIDNAFHELLQALVRQETAVGPIYVTYDGVFLTSGSDRKFTEWLLRNQQVVPRGLVFEAVSERRFHDPGEIHFQTRSLTDGTIRFEKDDVVKLKVVPAYAQMLLHRGVYLAYYNQFARAIPAFEQALIFDPSLKPAQDGLRKAREASP